MKKLFDPPEGDFYNYAPCLVQTDSRTKYVFYCSNQDSGVIVDYIKWRKGILKDGQWAWGPENTAFGPTENAWDSIHTCDPDVLQGSFRFRGHCYSWAMTYLGVAQWDCNANEIGIAFADSIQGPWVKFGKAIVPYTDKVTWGTGQDSMISLDEKGRFRMLYRDTDSAGDHFRYQDFDFSDAEHFTKTDPVTISQDGLGDGAELSHVAFDPVNKVYYMASERIWDGEKRCCREVEIAAMDQQDFEAGRGSWKVICTYSNETTGYFGNHNAAIGRDPYGRLVDLEVVVVAMSSGTEKGLYSFRINEAEIRLVAL